MLLGHSDSYVRDKQMQVTIAFNHFGAGLIQRMPRCYTAYPLQYTSCFCLCFALYNCDMTNVMVLKFLRCRHGYFHVVNNDYTHWEMYAIGGSASPTINSQGNRYLAPANPFAKEVNKLFLTQLQYSLSMSYKTFRGTFDWLWIHGFDLAWIVFRWQSEWTQLKGSGRVGTGGLRETLCLMEPTSPRQGPGPQPAMPKPRA